MHTTFFKDDKSQVPVSDQIRHLYPVSSQTRYPDYFSDGISGAILSSIQYPARQDIRIILVTGYLEQFYPVSSIQPDKISGLF